MSDIASDTQPFHRRPLVRLIARAFFICLLVVPVVLNLPKVIHYAYATDWRQVEDCDADGKDDVTGETVPWPGFDGTRGDTPAGPGTAQWWIDQNKAANGGTTGSTNGGSTSDSGGSSSGSSSGSGKTTTKSSGSVGTSTKTITTGGSGASDAAAAAPVAAAPVAAAPAATPVSAVATVSEVATAAVSTVATASAESTTVGAAGGTSSGGGGGPGSRSLWDALTVGFTAENRELLAGLALLGTLALAGALALGIGALRDVGENARQRGLDRGPAEEPVAGTT